MKQFITAWVIGLLVVLFVPREQKDAPQPRPPIQKAIVDKPSLSTREFPYSVVRGGVHNAHEAQDAMDDKVVKLHYAGIDTKRLEVTAFKTNALRYVSYRVSDQIFWTAKRVTIKAGEPVLYDGRSFIRARCGNRISEHPMQPTRRNEPSEEELETPVPEYSESSIAPPSLTNMFTAGSWDETVLIEQASEEAASPAMIGLGGSPGGYMIPPLTQPPVVAFAPPVLPPVGPPIEVPIEPPIMPPISPPPSLITPEPNSLVLFGGVLALGMATAGIKMVRDGLRKRGERRNTS